MKERIQNEIKHGSFLIEHGAENIWNWESKAGIIRMKRRVNMLCSPIKKNMKILEVGCGTGLFTREFVKTNAQITAIDISPDLINLAKEKTLADNVEFKLQNAYKLDFENESFDGIVGSSVLHHLDLSSALNEFYRVLKPGGFIRFTEPNMLNPQIFLERKFRLFFKYVSPDETAFLKKPLKIMIKQAGFMNIEIFPFDWLHPATPERLINTVSRIGSGLESTPIFREFAGSLFIHSVKQ